MTAPRTTFESTRVGLDRNAYPFRLWEKAKRLGTWDPAAFDFSQDAEDWQNLAPREQDLLLRLTAQFQGGEESVTRDLLPLLGVMADEGRVEDELFLTAYLWEEAKHVDAFDRFLQEVTGTRGGLEHYFTEPYKHIFFDALPRAMNRLQTDRSPEAQAEAAATYQMIVEGVLAETGYHAYYTILERHDLLPGLRALVQHVQRDEARHVAYGVRLLSRLVRAHGEAVWPVIQNQMDTLLPLAIDHIQASLASYGDDVPFGVQAEDFVMYGLAQFQKRAARIEKARSVTNGAPPRLNEAE